MTDLVDRVWTLLNRTLQVYRDSPRATHWLRRHLDRFDGPLRIAVVGQPKTGKSTLVNAIVGEQVAPVLLADDAPTMTWYQAGAVPRATVHPHNAPPQDLPVRRVDGRLDVDLGEWQGGGPVDRIVVDWPVRSLRGTTLIDTPAVSSQPDGEPRSSTLGGGSPGTGGGNELQQIGVEADAVLYLVQHLQATDIRLLQSMHDHPIAMANPVGAILVLARADEIGASQIDALFSAKQLARQLRRDVRTWPLCQDVVAVTGLLGHAGKTLRQHERAALTTLATAPRTELDSYLLSADRFAGPDFPAPLDAGLRHALLDRFGLFGLRLCTTLIRRGFDTHAGLGAELVQRSGLTELREATARYFTDRAQVLKARSALLALEVVLRMEPRPAARPLVVDLERTLAGAHDFRELRLLAALHGGRTVLPAELDTEARRLIGGAGVTLPARLGISDEPTATEVRHAASGALRRWQEQAENPVLDLSARQAAATVVRSCEGMLAGAAG